MNTNSDLAAELRKLQTARELTDELVVNLLNKIAIQGAERVPKKYELMELCHQGAWEQAGIWIARKLFPGWALTVSFELTGSAAYASLTGPAALDLRVETTANNPARAILEVLILARSKTLKLPLLHA